MAVLEAESVLQELLARYPALLTGGEEGVGGPWLLARREAGVGLGDGLPLTDTLTIGVAY